MVVGCVTADTGVCADGRICPRGFTCDEVHGSCVSPEQLTVCIDSAEGASCTTGGAEGICDLGVCLITTCGDGLVGDSEVCDDGNQVSGDGCSADCQSDESCGNGVVDEVSGEECDCGVAGALLPGGCGAPNSDEPGAQCKSTCIAHCGDGEVNAVEQCEASVLNSTTCVDAGFDRGHMACGLCQFNFQDCDSVGFRSEDALLLPSADAHVFHLFNDDRGVTAGDGYVAYWNGQAWTTTNVTYAETIVDAWASAPDNIVATTSSGSVQRWDGTAWAEVHSQATANRVWGRAANDVYVAGTSEPGVGELGQWDGNAWTTKDVGFELSAVWGLSSGELWVGGEKQVEQRVGGTWSALPALPTIEAVTITSIWPVAVGDLWVSAGLADTVGLVAHWDGVEWVEYPLGDQVVLGVWAAASNDVYATDGSHLYQYDGSGFVRLDAACVSRSLTGVDRPLLGCGGVVWSYHGTEWLAPVTSALTLAVEARSRHEVYVTQTSLSLHDGITAQTISVFGSRLDLAADGTLYAATPGAVYRWDDIGESYVYLGNVGSGARDLWASSDGLVFGVFRASGMSGGIWLLAHGNEDLAIDWIEWESSNPARILWDDIEGRSATDVFAAGAHSGVGYLAHFDGVEWSLVREEDVPLRALWFADDGTGYAVGDQGRILYYDGASWTPVSIPTLASLVTVHGSSPADVFTASADGEIWHFDGGRWSEVRGRFSDVSGLFVLPSAVYFFGAYGVDTVVRTKPW